MFSDKKGKVVPQKTTMNLISESTELTGDIVSHGDFRIDGIVEGTIKTTGRVIIGKKGIVKGKVYCENADIEGVFSGDLDVKLLLSLKSSSTLSGKVSIGKLLVEPGAEFNASCAMKGTVKELSTNDAKGISKKKKQEATAS